MPEMKVYYLASERIPSRLTDSGQVMRMCSALGKCGVDLTLVSTRDADGKFDRYAADIWGYYGVERSFSLSSLPIFQFRPGLMRAFLRPLLRVMLFGGYLYSRVARETGPFVVYSRSKVAAYLALGLRTLPGVRTRCRGVVLELHSDPHRSSQRRLVRRADAIIATTQALRKTFTERDGVPDARILVAPNAIDLDLAAKPAADRANAKAALGIEPRLRVVAYTGTLTAAKGLGTILRCAELLPDPDILFLLVGKHAGGRDERLLEEALRRMPHRIRYTGYVEPVRVPEFLAAADVLLLPSTGALAYAEYTSPMKLFEYMAARRPIVASDLAVLREVLRDGENALLAPADDAVAWCGSISRLLAHRDLADGLSRQAYSDVLRFTWSHRAERVIEFLRGLGMTENEAMRGIGSSAPMPREPGDVLADHLTELPR